MPRKQMIKKQLFFDLESFDALQKISKERDINYSQVVRLAVIRMAKAEDLFEKLSEIYGSG